MSTFPGDQPGFILNLSTGHFLKYSEEGILSKTRLGALIGNVFDSVFCTYDMNDVITVA